MAVYSLSYDLNKEGANYIKAKEKLEKRLEAYTRIRPMRSFWLLSSSGDPSSIGTYIKDCFDTNDTYLIERVTPDSYGRLSQASWDFIMKHN